VMKNSDSAVLGVKSDRDLSLRLVGTTGPLCTAVCNVCNAVVGVAIACT
jgi:hypothetical protein